MGRTTTDAIDISHMTELMMVNDSIDWLLANGGTDAEIAQRHELAKKYAAEKHSPIQPTGAYQRRPRSNGDAGYDTKATHYTRTHGDPADTSTDLTDLTPATRPVSAPPATGGRTNGGASRKAADYAIGLVRECTPAGDPQDSMVAEIEKFTGKQVSQIIDMFRPMQQKIRAGLVPAPAGTPERPKPIGAPGTVVDIPAGTYRLADGTNVKVDRPTRGNYAGWTFVRDTETDDRIRGDRAAQIITEIAKDPIGCMTAYGHATGECGKCHKVLDNPASITAGIGPWCAEHHYGMRITKTGELVAINRRKAA